MYPVTAVQNGIVCRQGNAIAAAPLQHPDFVAFGALEQGRIFADVVLAILVLLLHDSLGVPCAVLRVRCQFVAKLQSQPLCHAAVSGVLGRSTRVLISCVLGDCHAVIGLCIAHVGYAGTEDEVNAAFVVVLATLAIPLSAMQEGSLGLAQLDGIFELEGIAGRIHLVVAHVALVRPGGGDVRLLAHAVQVVVLSGIAVCRGHVLVEAAGGKVQVVLRIDALARASHAEVPAAHGLLEDRIGDTVLTVILQLVDDVPFVQRNALPLVLLLEGPQELSTWTQIKLAEVRRRAVGRVQPT
mmetsp:Transcript_123941/g.174846  ORF Transcript_123941/g.174846 Transcript_123941/m.174846 type:complete len:298 (+) Transcript_123941:255-1148(+)